MQQRGISEKMRLALVALYEEHGIAMFESDTPPPGACREPISVQKIANAIDRPMLPTARTMAGLVNHGLVEKINVWVVKDYETAKGVSKLERHYAITEGGDRYVEEHRLV